MSFDLGLEQKSFTEDEKISEFVDELSKKLHLVLIADYFDESLVLLKRLLCWDLEDIIYVKQKMRSITYKNSITSKQRVCNLRFCLRLKVYIIKNKQI